VAHSLALIRVVICEMRFSLAGVHERSTDFEVRVGRRHLVVPHDPLGRRVQSGGEIHLGRAVLKITFGQSQ
jgi:hypothetical protein